VADIPDEAAYRLEAIIGAHPTNDTAAARAVIEALRADPELAAQVLGGAGPLIATRATIRRCTTQGDPQ
jgi:hypothetical protein